MSADVTGFQKYLFQVGWAQSSGGWSHGEQHYKTQILSYNLWHKELSSPAANC